DSGTPRVHTVLRVRGGSVARVAGCATAGRGRLGERTLPRDRRHRGGVGNVRPAITGIAHVELSVSDVDASVEWYCRVLGAKDVWRGRNDEGGYRACAIREPVTGTVLAFTQTYRIEGGPFTPLRTGLDPLSFAVADDAALTAWSRYLDEIGI